MVHMTRLQAAQVAAGGGAGAATAPAEATAAAAAAGASAGAGELVKEEGVVSGAISEAVEQQITGGKGALAATAGRKTGPVEVCGGRDKERKGEVSLGLTTRRRAAAAAAGGQTVIAGDFSALADLPTTAAGTSAGTEQVTSKRRRGLSDPAAEAGAAGRKGTSRAKEAVANDVRLEAAAGAGSAATRAVAEEPQAAAADPTVRGCHREPVTDGRALSKAELNCLKRFGVKEASGEGRQADVGNSSSGSSSGTTKAGAVTRRRALELQVTQVQQRARGLGTQLSSGAAGVLLEAAAAAAGGGSGVGGKGAGELLGGVVMLPGVTTGRGLGNTTVGGDAEGEAVTGGKKDQGLKAEGVSIPAAAAAGVGGEGIAAAASKGPKPERRGRVTRSMSKQPNGVTGEELEGELVTQGTEGEGRHKDRGVGAGADDYSSCMGTRAKKKCSNSNSSGAGCALGEGPKEGDHGAVCIVDASRSSSRKRRVEDDGGSNRREGAHGGVMKGDAGGMVAAGGVGSKEKCNRQEKGQQEGQGRCRKRVRFCLEEAGGVHEQNEKHRMLLQPQQGDEEEEWDQQLQQEEQQKGKWQQQQGGCKQQEGGQQQQGQRDHGNQQLEEEEEGTEQQCCRAGCKVRAKTGHHCQQQQEIEEVREGREERIEEEVEEEQQQQLGSGGNSSGSPPPSDPLLQQLWWHTFAMYDNQLRPLADALAAGYLVTCSCGTMTKPQVEALLLLAGKYGMGGSVGGQQQQQEGRGSHGQLICPTHAAASGGAVRSDSAGPYASAAGGREGGGGSEPINSAAKPAVVAAKRNQLPDHLGLAADARGLLQHWLADVLIHQLELLMRASAEQQEEALEEIVRCRREKQEKQDEEERQQRQREEELEQQRLQLLQREKEREREEEEQRQRQQQQQEELRRQQQQQEEERRRQQQQQEEQQMLQARGRGTYLTRIGSSSSSTKQHGLLQQVQGYGSGTRVWCGGSYGTTSVAEGTMYSGYGLVGGPGAIPGYVMPCRAAAGAVRAGVGGGVCGKRPSDCSLAGPQAGPHFPCTRPLQQQQQQYARPTPLLNLHHSAGVPSATLPPYPWQYQQQQQQQQCMMPQLPMQEQQPVVMVQGRPMISYCSLLPLGAPSLPPAAGTTATQHHQQLHQQVLPVYLPGPQGWVTLPSGIQLRGAAGYDSCSGTAPQQQQQQQLSPGQTPLPPQQPQAGLDQPRVSEQLIPCRMDTQQQQGQHGKVSVQQQKQQPKVDQLRVSEQFSSGLVNAQQQQQQQGQRQGPAQQQQQQFGNSPIHDDAALVSSTSLSPRTSPTTTTSCCHPTGQLGGLTHEGGALGAPHAKKQQNEPCSVAGAGTAAAAAADAAIVPLSAPGADGPGPRSAASNPYPTPATTGGAAAPEGATDDVEASAPAAPAPAAAKPTLHSAPDQMQCSLPCIEAAFTMSPVRPHSMITSSNPTTAAATAALPTAMTTANTAIAMTSVNSATAIVSNPAMATTTAIAATATATAANASDTNGDATATASAIAIAPVACAAVQPLLPTLPSMAAATATEAALGPWGLGSHDQQQQPVQAADDMEVDGEGAVEESPLGQQQEGERQTENGDKGVITEVSDEGIRTRDGEAAGAVCRGPLDLSPLHL